MFRVVRGAASGQPSQANSRHSAVNHSRSGALQTERQKRGADSKRSKTKTKKKVLLRGSSFLTEGVCVLSQAIRATLVAEPHLWPNLIDLLRDRYRRRQRQQPVRPPSSPPAKCTSLRGGRIRGWLATAITQPSAGLLTVFFFFLQPTSHANRPS